MDVGQTMQPFLQSGTVKMNILASFKQNDAWFSNWVINVCIKVYSTILLFSKIPHMILHSEMKWMGMWIYIKIVNQMICAMTSSELIHLALWQTFLVYVYVGLTNFAVVTGLWQTFLVYVYVYVRFILMRLRKIVEMLIKTCNGRDNVSYWNFLHD